MYSTVSQGKVRNITAGRLQAWYEQFWHSPAEEAMEHFPLADDKGSLN